MILFNFLKVRANLFAHRQMVSSIAIKHKLSYSTLFVHFHTIKRFLVLLCNTNNSIICLHTVKWSNNSILLNDGIQSGTNTSDKSGPGNEGLLHIFQISGTGALP